MKIEQVWRTGGQLALLAMVALGAGCGPGGAQGPEGDVPLATVEQEAGGNTRWTRRSVGTPGRNTFLEDIVIDRDGNSIGVGSYGGAPDFGGGPLPAAGGSTGFIVKHAQDGRLLWARGYPSLSSFRAVVTDRERNIIFLGFASPGGTFEGHPIPEGLFIMKLSSRGGFRWVRSLSGSTTFGFGASLTVDLEDNILMAGSLEGTMDLGGGPRTGFEAAFLVKYTKDGTWLWDRVFNTEDSSHFGGVATDEANHIFVAGFFIEGGDFGGGPLPVVDSDSQTPVVARFSPSGAHVWSRTLDGMTSSARFRSVAIHGNRVVLGGDFTGSFRFGGRAITARNTTLNGMVLAMTRDGEDRWGRSLGLSVLEVKADLEDDITVLGVASPGHDVGTGPLPSTPSRHFFVSKFDRVHGTQDWVRTFDNEAASVTFLGVARHGEVVVAGSFLAPVNFGTGRLSPTLADNFDAFIFRTNP